MRPASLCSFLCPAVPILGLLASLDAMCEPGKHISDRDFFNELDLATPGLEPVRAATDEGDYEQAKSLLLTYFQARKEPKPYRFIKPYYLKWANKDELLGHAAKLMDHQFYRRTDGRWIALGNPVNWRHEAFRDPCDYSLLVGLNPLPVLCKAYQATGDEQYVESYLDWFKQWWDRVDVPGKLPQDSYRWPQGLWGPPQGAIHRLRRHMVGAYFVLIHSKTITPEWHAMLLKNIFENLRNLYLSNDALGPVRHAYNLQIIQCQILLQLSQVFPEFSAAPRWRVRALRRIAENAAHGTLPDGGYIERCAYNYGVIETLFLDALIHAKRARMAVPPELLSNLERLYEWCMYTYTPDLSYIAVGDAGSGTSMIPRTGISRGPMTDAALLFGRPEFRFFAHSDDQHIRPRATYIFGDEADAAVERFREIRPRPPKKTSVLLRDTGWAIFRSDWTERSPYLLFNMQDPAGSHKHREALNFSLYAYGKYLITETGGAHYGTDVFRNWYLTTEGHNVLKVDDEEIVPREAKPQLHAWTSDRASDFLSVTHFAYQQKLGVTHTRSVLYIKPDLFVLHDRVAPPRPPLSGNPRRAEGAGQHVYRWLAHFQPTQLRIDEKARTVATDDPEGAGAQLAYADPEADLERLRGHINIPGSREAANAPYIALRKEGEPPVTFCVAVSVHPEAKGMPGLSVEQLDAGGRSYRIGLGERTYDVVFGTRQATFELR